MVFSRQCISQTPVYMKAVSAGVDYGANSCVRSRELDSMILMGPFRLGILYGSMKYLL